MEIQAVNPNFGAANVVPTGNTRSAAQAKEEFIAVFYEQLLKQVFKAPSLSMQDDEENQGSTFTAAFTSELMARTLAEQMAKNSMMNAQWLALAKGVK
ncbi:MAG: hypothetical protein ABIH50_04690 [bacterium]